MKESFFKKEKYPIKMKAVKMLLNAITNEEVMAVISRNIDQQQGKADNKKKEPKCINVNSKTCRIVKIWKFNIIAWY